VKVKEEQVQKKKDMGLEQEVYRLQVADPAKAVNFQE